jgi:integrase
MVNREITILKGICTKAIDWGFLAKNPVKGIKLAREKERIRYLNASERARLIEASTKKGRPYYLKSLVVLGFLTGLRKNELLHVTWEDINVEQNVLRVLDGKGGDTRFVPLNETAKVEIFSLFKKAKGPYLFHDRKGKPFKDIKKTFNEAVRGAKLEDVTFHDLRKTFATECVFNGVPPKTLQKWMGHKKIQTTMKHYVVSPDDYEQEAIKKLDGMLDSGTDTQELRVSEKAVKSLDKIGGAEGYRTLGLMTASHALSQLSYSPTNYFNNLHVEKFPLPLVNVVRHDIWDDIGCTSRTGL